MLGIEEKCPVKEDEPFAFHTSSTGHACHFRFRRPRSARKCGSSCCRVSAGGFCGKRMLTNSLFGLTRNGGSNHMEHIEPVFPVDAVTRSREHADACECRSVLAPVGRRNGVDFLRAVCVNQSKVNTAGSSPSARYEKPKRRILPLRHMNDLSVCLDVVVLPLFQIEAVEQNHDVVPKQLKIAFRQRFGCVARNCLRQRPVTNRTRFDGVRCRDCLPMGRYRP